MSPAKVNRQRLEELTDLPNVGKATAADLRLIGIEKPSQLVGRNAFELYERLCERTGQRHDPCVIDVFLSITSFADGGPARPWWDFTEQRKRRMLETM